MHIDIYSKFCNGTIITVLIDKRVDKVDVNWLYDFLKNYNKSLPVKWSQMFYVQTPITIPMLPRQFHNYTPLILLLLSGPRWSATNAIIELVSNNRFITGAFVKKTLH